MTPEEKAQELIDKYSDLEDGEMYIVKAKQCALIAVDEILEILYNSEISIQELNYWEEVKYEIEQL